MTRRVGVIAIVSVVFWCGTASAKNLLDTAADAGTFTVFLAAVKATGLTDVLSQPGPITIFAPTDDAFAKLPRPELEGLLKLENRDKTRKLLAYHIVMGKVTSRELLGKRLEAANAEGGSLLIDATKGIMVNDAKVIRSDIIADNGFIQVIDTVVMPK